MKKRLLFMVQILFVLIPSVSYSSDDVEVIREKILGKNKVGYGLNFTYRTLSSTNQNFIEDILKVGDDFVPVIRLTGPGETNIDSYIITPSIYYGLSNRLSLYGQLSHVSTNRRSTDGSNSYDERDSYISGINTGLRLKLLNGNGFGISGNIGTALAVFDSLSTEKLVFDPGKNISIGFTTYKIVDSMIMLNMSLGYSYTMERKVYDLDYNPPDTLHISPSIAFSVSPRITLNGGFTWQRDNVTKINGAVVTRDMVRTSMNADFGMNYVISDKLGLGVNLSSDMSGDGGAALSVSLSYY